MGKLPKEEVCILIFAALILMSSAVPRRYFLQPRKLSWDDARKHCQLCFKDLVTVTPDNVQTIAQNLTSDHWIGLRKNFDYTSNSTNSTSYTTSSPMSYSTSYWTSSSTSYSTSNTSNTSLNWSRWADGDRLIFQNWYPGWPVFKSHFPKRDCCSCSCTCPAKTTPFTTTDYRTTSFMTDGTTNSSSFSVTRMQNGTNGTTDGDSVTGNMTNSSSFSVTRMQNGTNGTTDGDSVTGNMTNSSSFSVTRMQNGTNGTTDGDSVTGNMTNFSSLWEYTTTAMPSTTTAVPPTTPELPLEAECVRSPMLFPDVPDPDENYIEDSCVAMLSFGPWVEKNCFELLPFICYDDDFIFETSVTNLTSVSATLTWQSVPAVSHYKLQIKGDIEKTSNLTNLTETLVNLTPGTHYSVLVFPVKCGRDLKPQEFSFTTIPNKVENFTVIQNETSTIYLSWDKPVGKVDDYRIQYSGEKLETKSTHAKVSKLTPGGLYTFTIVSVAKDPNFNSTLSEASTITVYTKPGKVSNLRASNNSREWLLLSWDPPMGNTTGYWVKAVGENNILKFNQTVTETKVNVTGLPVSRKINLTVIALANHTLKGDTVTISSFTAPEPVKNLGLNSTHTTITAKWNASSLSKFSLFNIELILDNVMVQKYNNMSEPTKKFENLKTAANYTVIVYISNGHVNGPSETKSIFTLPSPPTNLKVTSQDKESIKFSWTAPANSLTVTYVVEITSDFWGYNMSVEVCNKTQHTFKNLMSGTKYDLKVKTKAGGAFSLPEHASHFTDPDLRQITLSMMCSSEETLLCDDSTIKKNVFQKLNGSFNNILGSSVFWQFKQNTIN